MGPRPPAALSIRGWYLFGLVAGTYRKQRNKQERRRNERKSKCCSNEKSLETSFSSSSSPPSSSSIALKKKFRSRLSLLLLWSPSSFFYRVLLDPFFFFSLRSFFSLFSLFFFFLFPFLLHDELTTNEDMTHFRRVFRCFFKVTMMMRSLSITGLLSSSRRKSQSWLAMVQGHLLLHCCYSCHCVGRG